MVRWIPVIVCLIIVTVISAILGGFSATSEYASTIGVIVGALIVGAWVDETASNGAIHGGLISAFGVIIAMLILFIAGTLVAFAGGFLTGILGAAALAVIAIVAIIIAGIFGAIFGAIGAVIRKAV